MQIQEFTRLVAKHEGKKKQVSIAQINEVVKVVNDLTDGELYKVIKRLDKVKKPKRCGFIGVIIRLFKGR